MNRPPPSKFFLEDIVRRFEEDEEDGEIAIVLRHWHDSDPATHPPELEDDPLNRALQPGEIGVSNLISGEHFIAKESDYVLADRCLQPGDLVKKRINDVVSGVVVETMTEAKVEHAISGAAIEGWLSTEDLEQAVEVFIGDYIICDDWVGQIEEIFDEALAQLPSGDLFRFAELGGRYQVGDRGTDVLPESSLRQANFDIPAGLEDILLVQVKPTVLAISWLALNQALPLEVASGRQRPKVFWTLEELSQLVIVRPRALLRVGERVAFKNASVAEMHGMKNTRHGNPGSSDGMVEVDTLIVRETRNTVRILWQDGTISADVPSVDVVPYANVDEYDCWPGDYVLWKGEDESRAGVVQFANAKDRTAQVHWRTPSIHPSSAYATVSVLELDPHGTASQQDNPDCIGVRRGDFVFIHPVGSTNGTPLPRVPKIGEPEAWVRDLTANGWRHDLAHAGMDYSERNKERGDEFDARIVWKDPGSMDWFGEVTNLKTSGEVEVTLPSGVVSVVPLERLTLLMDSASRDSMGLWGDEEMEDGGASMAMPGILGVDGVPMQDLEQFFYAGMDPEPTNQQSGHADSDWESYGSAEDELAPPLVAIEALANPQARVDVPAKNGEVLDEMEVDAISAGTISGSEYPSYTTPPVLPLKAVATSSPSGSSTHGYAQPKPTTPTSSSSFRPTPIPTPPSTNASTPSPPNMKPSPLDEEDLNGSWQRFSVLPSAPRDHAFLASKAATRPSRAFMTRLAKEYRVLSTSLPESILVRAYEDRVDLLRSMIIGPENTPYEGAPFVIDWYLDDSFPSSPPVAHFHSWTNGNGRVNPNLYEEGKVCLSILGTWAGDKSESWSPSRSSLLQALVSIQGLVLVKEPFFCEPAFEKLRGTEEACVNSRLYSEKAYVLSRGFVRRALELPPMGLEREIEYHYIEQGKLEGVIQQTNDLIRDSENKDKGAADVVDAVPGWEDKAIPELTPGAVLPLRRTLAKLEGLLVSRKAAVAATSADGDVKMAQ